MALTCCSHAAHLLLSYCWTNAPSTPIYRHFTSLTCGGNALSNLWLEFPFQKFQGLNHKFTSWGEFWICWLASPWDPLSQREPATQQVSENFWIALCLPWVPLANSRTFVGQPDSSDDSQRASGPSGCFPHLLARPSALHCLTIVHRLKPRSAQLRRPTSACPSTILACTILFHLGLPMPQPPPA